MCGHSYRRFNHFDELSARFWGRSWPGSDDSLDNPAFTRSDELLHLRALDRTCCYHDDTLSVVSTYHGSGTHLNTIYPHGYRKIICILVVIYGLPLFFGHGTMVIQWYSLKYPVNAMVN